MVRNAGNSRKQQHNSLLASVESFTERQTPAPTPVPSAMPVPASAQRREGRDIVMLSGHVYRTFTTRVTPEHQQALRMAAVEHDTTAQAVVNALIEEGLVQGKCSLGTVEDYRERRR